MSVLTWSDRDQAWVARYRRSMTGKDVPVAVLEQRERELLHAVHQAGVPALELFGDAAVLAAEDAAELATADEAIRSSEGGGLRPFVREVGGTLCGLAGVASLGTWARHGSSVDVDVASVLIAASLTVVFLSWTAGRALLSAGQGTTALGVLLAAVVTGAAGITAAVQVGVAVVARDVPVPVLAVVLLAPGVCLLLLSSRLPQPVLRQHWDDAEWLRRFEGGLRSRLVPATARQGHVDEVQQAVRTGATTASDEFGHPLVLARLLADADRTARARLWWASTVLRTGLLLALTALVHANQSYGALTSPLVVLLALAAVGTVLARWNDRPWKERA